MSYEPTGVIRPFIEAVRNDPARIWTSEEAAKVMDVQQSRVSAWLSYPMAQRVVFRGKKGSQVVYSGQPFPPEAAFPPPAQRQEPALEVPRFVPAPMRAPRPGSEHPRVLASSPRPAPFAVSTVLPMPPMPPVLEEVTNPEPAPQISLQPDPSPSVDEPLESGETGDEPLEEVGEEAAEPDAFISCRTGEIVLIGCPVDDEGRVTVPADLVMAIRRKVAWMPSFEEAAC